MHFDLKFSLFSYVLVDIRCTGDTKGVLKCGPGR